MFIIAESLRTPVLCRPRSVAERAQVANWFYIHMAEKDQARSATSVGLLPLAHVVTLFIAHN